MPSANSYRLPGNITPMTYDLSLTPDLEKFTFAGKETIKIKVNAATKSILINAIDLKISNAEIALKGGKKLKAQKISLDDKAERATLAFGQTIPPGDASLTLEFTGTLNDQLRGFYRSKYTNPEGKEVHLATTQFEATDARRAFPCWDEPSIKATFKLTLVIPKDLVAISNMPIAKESAADNGKKAVQFEESPRMSTYLVAFVVGDMKCVEADAVNGTKIRVWATRGKEQQGKFALENAVKLLAYMNKYFGVPYPLKKLDHIAIPDFAAGAMENWGSITYREAVLLFDPKTSAANTRQRILEVVAHEMAHMWFGDLVTMAWWDDLWLNESFASWFGDKSVDHLYPEWEMWTQFVYQDTNSGLSLDGLRNSHPIEANVKDPSEIRELFDAISYSKGGAVLRMLEDFLGPETFRKGLGLYMKKHRYSNARTADLWEALQEASQKPVTKLMDSWVKQMGYPVLTADIKRSGKNATVAVTQQRFLYDNLLDGKGTDKTLWQVPVTTGRAGASKPSSILLDKRSASVPLGAGKAPNAEDWVKLNAGQTGFYRVQYPNKEWSLLSDAVATKKLPAIDRLGLEDDAYALVRGGYAPATLFLSLASAYKNEDDVSVWRDLTANLHGIETIVADQVYLEKFRSYAGGLFKDAAKRVGWDPKKGEGHMDSLLRSTVLSQAGYYSDPGVVKEARARFNGYLKNPESLHPDLRSMVLGTVAQHGDEKTYGTLWDLHNKATTQEERNRFLVSLARFHDRELLADVLQRALGPEVRLQDSVTAIGATAGNVKGRDLAWDFVKRNWKELDRRYGRGGFAITRLVSITSAFTTEERLKEVEQFFKTHPAPSAARTISQSLERIQLNIKWLDKNGKELRTFFASGAR